MPRLKNLLLVIKDDCYTCSVGRFDVWDFLHTPIYTSLKSAFFFLAPPEQRCNFGALEESAAAFLNMFVFPPQKQTNQLSFFFFSISFLWLFGLNWHTEKSNNMDINGRGKKTLTHQWSLILLLPDFISDDPVFIPSQISHFIWSLYGIRREWPESNIYRWSLVAFLSHPCFCFC